MQSFLNKELLVEVEKIITTLEVFINLNSTCYLKVEEAIKSGFAVLEFGTLPGKTLNTLEQKAFNNEISFLYKCISRISGGKDGSPEILYYMDGSLREYIKTSQEAAKLIGLITSIYVGATTAHVKIDTYILDMKIKEEIYRKKKLENGVLESNVLKMNEIAIANLQVMSEALYEENKTLYDDLGINQAELSKSIIKSFSVLSKTMSKGGYSKVVALPLPEGKEEQKLQEKLVKSSNEQHVEFLKTATSLLEEKERAATLLYKKAFAGKDVINDKNETSLLHSEEESKQTSANLQ